MREEEIKWYERAKVKTPLEGDDNIKFFHPVANGKHRKQHIYKLENDQGVVIGDAQLKSYITQFYKDLFGPPDDSDITLEEDRIQDIPQVTREDMRCSLMNLLRLRSKVLFSKWNTTRPLA